MRLPNADRAIIDVEKLRDYCLSESHPRGKHKAIVFKAKLGLTVDHVNDLAEALLAAVMDQEATLDELDEYGQRYKVDFLVRFQGKEAMIRSAWIIRKNEDMPRLTSCYVL